MKTLLIGIDAACQPVLEPLFERRRVPTLRALFEEGASGPLESQIPPWTASAWPSLYTGMNPGKHGVFGFLHFEGYEWDVVNATHVRERPIWQIADRHDLSSVVVNVPVTHPPEPFDGALIPGYAAPEDPACHPSGILDEVREAVGTYRIYSEGDVDGVDADEAADRYRAFVRSRGAAFRYLADRFDPDFGFLQFQQTDTVCHEYPGELDLVRAVYEAVDREVDRTLDACDPDTVVVASDHGIGAYDGYEFRVNEFLRDAGFVESTTAGAGMPSWVTVREERLQTGDDEGSGGPAAADEHRDGGVPGPVTTAMALAARFGVTSQRVARALRALGLADAVAGFVPDDLQRAGAESVDFERSRAYLRDPIELGVRINLAGRDPAGTVSRVEYERVRRDLIDALESVTTPDGEPVFETVARREAYFHGPAAADAVDVVTVPAEFDQALSAQLYGERFGEPTEPWNHKRFGVVAASGDAVDESADVAEAHLFDVAPTVLSALGVPWDERMDGRPLSAVDATDARAYPEPTARPTRATDDDAVEAHLADLGYIEGDRHG